MSPKFCSVLSTNGTQVPFPLFSCSAYNSIAFYQDFFTQDLSSFVVRRNPSTLSSSPCVVIDNPIHNHMKENNCIFLEKMYWLISFYAFLKRQLSKPQYYGLGNLHNRHTLSNAYGIRMGKRKFWVRKQQWNNNTSKAMKVLNKFNRLLQWSGHQLLL